MVRDERVWVEDTINCESMLFNSFLSIQEPSESNSVETLQQKMNSVDYTSEWWNLLLKYNKVKKLLKLGKGDI